jgi:para-nitrobenzyl esterase
VRRTLLAVAVASVLTVLTVVVVLLVLPREDRSDPPSPGADGATSEPQVPSEPMTGSVETTSGPVRGVRGQGVRAWLGLPYAAPPTGPLRWRPPAVPTPWRRVRAADRFGASCLQPTAYEFGQERLTARPESSEDCLYLNVVRPDDRTTGLPVMVWLHGGGFFAGSGSSVVGAATALVRRGIVLVTVNYRLGRLGFFGHPSLPGDIGNFGLLDQVAALQWVRDNAAAFGGDPENVTLAGGSAGAMSVNALMATPAAEGLFARAISQSAPSDALARPLAQAREQGAAAYPGLTAAQLRRLPADQLLDSRFNTLAGDAPLLDAVLPEPSATAFADGTEQRVPYLVGTTTEEFSDAAYRSFDVDPEEARDALGGRRHDDLVAAYGDAYDSEVLDDLVFDLPAVERAVTHGRRAPTYRYTFRGVGYAGHGAEGAYVFDTVEGGAGGRLSDAVADYWVAFMRAGRPDVAGLPTWPEAGGETPAAYLELAPGGPVPHDEDDRLSRLGALRLAVS